MPLTNCTICAKLFNRTTGRVCPACLASDEEEFERVVEYMREHNVRSILDLASGAGVQRTRIVQWIRDGKLELREGVNHAEGACKRCGKPAGGGDICGACRAKLAREIAQQRSLIENRASAADPYAGMHSREPGAQ